MVVAVLSVACELVSSKRGGAKTYLETESRPPRPPARVHFRSRDRLPAHTHPRPW